MVTSLDFSVSLEWIRLDHHITEVVDIYIHISLGSHIFINIIRLANTDAVRWFGQPYLILVYNIIRLGYLIVNTDIVISVDFLLYSLPHWRQAYSITVMVIPWIISSQGLSEIFLKPDSKIMTNADQTFLLVTALCFGWFRQETRGNIFLHPNDDRQG